MASDIQDVRRAISNGEFLPYFQPLVALRTGQLQGFELLARWDHPRKGWIPPDEFIPDAERDGWIDALTGELLRKGFSAIAALPRSLMLAVNISPLQLHDLGLPKQIQSEADTAGFSLERLTVEITESALMSDVERAQTIAHELKRMGCKLALDDFGTGHSSLTHLQSLPFDELKVDRSFVGSMTQERECRKIVAAVVGLGQSLGLTTVAEGVESLEQAEMLLWLGCDLCQGWLYGKPVPAREIMAVVSAPQQKVSPSLPNAAAGRMSCSSLEMLPAQRLAQLQAVYDGAPVGLAFLDRDLRYMNVNRRLADIVGSSMEARLGKTVQESVPEIFPHVEPYIKRALKGESIAGVETTVPAIGAREEKAVLISYEPAYDEAGEVIGVSVAVMDATRLKHAEEARRESEEHFQHMIELIPQIPWVIDPEGRALKVSQRWLDLSGMTGEQWKGFGWLDALHPDDLQPTLDAMNRSFKDGQPIDVAYRLRPRGGNWKLMRARGSARFGADGKIMCWYGSLEEIDENK